VQSAPVQVQPLQFVLEIPACSAPLSVSFVPGGNLHSGPHADSVKKKKRFCTNKMVLYFDLHKDAGPLTHPRRFNP
jgi:hypothetical protein